ncbi:MAG: hypothetical protein J6T70_20500 [Bacteroidales bacterium]|nr:hypothetical protein [Bacteroidales bacterium]
MAFIKKYISSIILGAVVLIAILGFYSPMYAYQEGLQIFMTDGDFFADTCLRPGGMSDYIGCFLVQFFMYPHWLAIFVTALVIGLQLIIKSIIIKNTNAQFADVLSVICAAGMIAAVTEFNVLFGGCISILLAVSAVKVADLSKNMIVLSVLTPIVYWITGGFGCIIYIIGVASGYSLKNAGLFSVINIATLLLTFLVVKNIMQDDSLIDTFVGVDYNRYTTHSCKVWNVSIWIIIACLVISTFLKTFQNRIIILSLYSITAIGLTTTLITNYDARSMLDFTVDKMSRYKNWGGIINTMQNRKSVTKVSLCYLNIALNELGLLNNKMFNFMQLGTEGIISQDIDSQDKSIVNSEIYFRLGLMNIAERLAIDATESNQNHQKSARQYKRLAEIAIIRKDKQLAYRYLNKLKNTLYYSAWANRALEYINNPDKVEPLSDWKIEPLKFEQQDAFFTPKYKSDFILILLGNNPHNNKLFNYYVGTLLLEKNIEKLYNFVAQYRPEGDLGIHVYEAILLYLSLNNQEEFKKVMNENTPLTNKFQNFCNFMVTGGNKDVQKAEELYGNTYWFYYSFCENLLPQSANQTNIYAFVQ